VDPLNYDTAQNAESKPEVWRPVVGYEGLYEVSSLGRVRSLDRRNPRVVKGTNCFVLRRGKILSGSHGGRDLPYHAVVLCRDGLKRTVYAHILVAQAFIGPRPTGMMVLHGVNGIEDNSAANLRYGTARENMEDRKRDGTYLKGSDVPGSKLTDSLVVECRKRFRDGGITLTDLACEFGLSRPALSAAVRGRTWKHVAEPPVPAAYHYTKPVSSETREKIRAARLAYSASRRPFGKAA
jgi:hypothetical protein